MIWLGIRLLVGPNTVSIRPGHYRHDRGWGATRDFGVTSTVAMNGFYLLTDRRRAPTRAPGGLTDSRTYMYVRPLSPAMDSSAADSSCSSDATACPVVPPHYRRTLVHRSRDYEHDAVKYEWESIAWAPRVCVGLLLVTLWFRVHCSAYWLYFCSQWYLTS